MVVFSHEGNPDSAALLAYHHSDCRMSRSASVHDGHRGCSDCIALDTTHLPVPLIGRGHRPPGDVFGEYTLLAG